MHVWVKLTKEMPFELAPKIEEGLCQFIAMKYLEFAEIAQSPTALAPTNAQSEQWREELRKYFRYQIEKDTSPVYGDGFREAAVCCATLGLDIVVEYVRENRTFPDVS
jgi:hypothetical protein